MITFFTNVQFTKDFFRPPNVTYKLREIHSNQIMLKSKEMLKLKYI